MINNTHRRYARTTTLSLLLLGSICLPACGGSKKAAPPPIKSQSAADEVLRIGDVWTSKHPEKGILSPPSKVSMFNNRRSSQLTLSAKSVTERLVINEELQLRNGTTITCQTEFAHDLQFRWGRKNGEAALELIRPSITGLRSCSAPHPEGSFNEAPKRALFVLRSDNLVSIEPALDRRTYIPAQL